MAKRVNKSDEIRKVAATGLTSPKDIVAKLAAGPKKIKVSSALVSNVLTRGKKKKRKGKKRGRKPGTASNGHLNVEAVLQAKVYVAKVGSIGEAKAALDLLQRITG